MTSVCIDKHIDATIYLTDCPDTLLSIIPPEIGRLHDPSSEHPGGIAKSEATLADVAGVLERVPVELHGRYRLCHHTLQAYRAYFVTPIPRMNASRIFTGSRSVVSIGFSLSIRQPISHGPSSFSATSDQFLEGAFVGGPGALREPGRPGDPDDIGALLGHASSGRR